MVLCCTFFTKINGQQLKTSHDPKANKGHQLYKQTKIYDNSTSEGTETKPRPVGDRASDRNEYEFNLLKNPYTGKIPKGIKKLELKFSKSIPLETSPLTLAKNGGSRFVNRGPYNVGGRTRALAIDRNNENRIFAGGVSGGLWLSKNGGDSWSRITKKLSPSITCIVQDPRPDYVNVWYYGSGERAGNSASGGAAFYTGAGVYKSTDGGRTWNVLAATDDQNKLSTSPFDIINSIAVNPSNGDVYVATFNGVHKSQDGGNTFVEVLAGGFDNWTEVIITPSGKIYATVDYFGGPNFGFYSSEDGDNWIDITPTSISVFNGRTVMTYDPSNEDIVYFFAENYLSSTSPLLLRYNAAAADPNDLWTDLSSNLPTNIGGSVGSLNLQGNYNMFIKVKPDNPNFIVLGGTNLYRSTTGFTTPADQESWIGGYSPLNNVSVYNDHHPDQHNFIFYPSNPNKALSANDGGVQVTDDINTSLSVADPVDWISLNSGYLTTQSYAVSFDPEPNSDDLLSGFQDNGSWYTDSVDPTASWIEDFGGDGSYNAIADNGKTRYVSSQFANIYRLNFDDAGNFISFARIRPAIASSPIFIAPFILDPNNDNIMYLPDGNRILRNNDLDGVPGGTFNFATVNWVDLPQSSVSGTITALDISRYPQANRLYYGTNNGGIYRMDNANLDNQPLIDISSGKGLPPGNVSNITVDPSNSDRAMVAFSNYGIPSLFFTNDAGETWIDISSNLEENPDGTGNGPSVRWASFFGNGHKYYVATSVGLFKANSLNGNNTSWSRVNIRNTGENVVVQVKSRKDGFIALATHGNGLISGKFEIPSKRQIPESSLNVTYLLDDLTVDLNSDDTVIDITGLFESSVGGDIDIELTNSNPALVTASLNDNILTLSYTANTEGSSTVGIIANSGGETVSEGFTVTVVEPPIYEQIEAPVSSAPSQFFLDFGGLAQSSDDFTVPEGSVWMVNRVLAFGGANGTPVFDNATVVIYEDDGGRPGVEVYNSGTVTPISDPNNANLNIQLPEETQLESGSYWLVVYSSFAFAGGNQWFWNTQATVNGVESHFRDEANLFGTGAVDWAPASIAFGRAPADQVFQIFGTTGDDDTSESNNVENSLATLDAKLVPLAWPNPSTDQFNFNISELGGVKNLGDKATLRIFNIRGQLIYEKSDLDANRTFTWDASGKASGLYLVNIAGKNFKYKGKLIKK